jgi:hypothetical protein
MADKRDLEQLIEAHGGVLVRSRKHRIYTFPDGTKFTAPSTPRCPHAYANAISALKRILNLNEPNRGQVGDRRERRKKGMIHRPTNQQHSNTAPLPSWKDKLFAVKTEVFSFEEIMANNGTRPTNPNSQT